MAMLRIANLQAAGLNSDLAPSELPPSFLTNCENVRSQKGGISPFGGISDVIDFPETFNPYGIFYVASNEVKKWFIVGDSDVFMYDATLQSVKPDSLTSPLDEQWTYTMLADVAVINHPAIGPMYKSFANDKFVPLPWSLNKTWKDVGQSCSVMVSHKQFLFALNLVDGGVEKTDGVRWSAPADIGGIPPTWDHLDTTQVAGYTRLGGDGGSIIGALPMKDSLVIYRTNGISVLDPVGGRYVWRVRHMDSAVGLISAKSVVDVGGVHYFISDGDVYRNDGNQVTSIAHDRVRGFLNSINKTHFERCYAIHNPSKKEILFCIPTTNSDYPDVAMVYSYLTNCWLTRSIPYSLDSAYGITQKTSTAWDDLNTTWDGFDRSWSDDSTTPFDKSILTITTKKDTEPAKIVRLDSILGFNNEPFRSIIERTDLRFGDYDQTNTIQSVFLHIQGGSNIYIQVGSQMYSGGPVTWKLPVLFDATKRKADVRATGLLHAYRVYCDQVDTEFVISGIDFTYVQDGKR